MSKNIGNLQDKNGNLLFPNAIETVTNNNGTALKFANGIMICYGYIHLNTKVIVDWGPGLYVSSQYAGVDYAASFIGLPTVTMSINASASTWLMTGSTPTSTKTPSFWITCGTKLNDNWDFYISFIAIGRWK